VDALLAAFWGFIGGASLLLGALLGLYAGASQRVISVVMAVGAGVLISSVAFELMEEAYRKGGFDSPAIGLLLGALLYFAADLAVSRHAKDRKRSRGPQAGGLGHGDRRRGAHGRYPGVCGHRD
jgi:zinc transporter, ZIP family